MTGATARKELAAAKQAGFCPCCFARATPGTQPPHERDCKIVNSAGIRRKR